jgi:hypothetical protein
MGSPSTQNEVTYQTVKAEVTIQGQTFGTTEKFSSDVIEQNHYIPKELALKTLKNLVEKIETEIASGNLN